MSIEESTQSALLKTAEIKDVISEIEEVCRLVLFQRKTNGDTIQLPLETKQKLIQRYLTLKSKLKTLADELP